MFNFQYNCRQLIWLHVLSRQFQTLLSVRFSGHVYACIVYSYKQVSTDQEVMGERAPLLARAVGGKVLGPRPGLAIVSFWQGILEIILRALALVSHTSDRHHATTKLARLQIYGCRHVCQGGIDDPYLYPYYSLV